LKTIRVAVIGCGRMAQSHIKAMLLQRDSRPIQYYRFYWDFLSREIGQAVLEDKQWRDFRGGAL
jgi:hypothetical protein